MINKLSHYVQKSARIGLRNVFKICFLRVRCALVHRYWRRCIAQGKRVNKLFFIDHVTHRYDNFFTRLKSKNLSYIKLFYDGDISTQQWIEQADAYVHNHFSFLGSHPQRYTHIPWHTDFRLQQQDNAGDFVFDKISFYKDLGVQQGTKNTLVKDIKVPWELSRFQYLYALAKAYEYTNEQSYVQAFQRYVTDWLDTNPYACGINWQCPMEVGIRAINWIVAWEFFKDDPAIADNFWQRFTSSLYDHMIYLENNWEYYDSRTNNHYLSNIVAYLYLCWFFNDMPGVYKKRAWVVQEILREFNKQVFTEGTSYEGSTYYHALVTELFYHAYLLFKEMNIEVLEDFCTILSRMFAFIDWCAPDGAAMPSIGDNDSGKVLYYGLTRTIITQMQTSSAKISVIAQQSVAYFSHFGLSIIKTDEWHVTLRHHAYNALQPSGHFHNDIGSITLAVGGISILVDPGSFVYTPSVIWRNYFRSVAVHNTSFIANVEPVALNDELFALHMPERLVGEAPIVHDRCVSMHAMHTMYASLGLEFKRQLKMDDGGICITDAWVGDNQKQELTCVWNFTLAPDIRAYKNGDGWLVTHHQIPLLIMQSHDLVFSLHETWASQEYGQKTVTQSLRASRPLSDSQITIKFSRA